MSKPTTLDKESIKLIADSRAKALELSQTAQAAIKDAKIAELEFKNTIQQVYIEKGLDPKCNIDLSTGGVTWPEDQEVSKETKEEAIVE